MTWLRTTVHLGLLSPLAVAAACSASDDVQTVVVTSSAGAAGTPASGGADPSGGSAGTGGSTAGGTGGTGATGGDAGSAGDAPMGGAGGEIVAGGAAGTSGAAGAGTSGAGGVGTAGSGSAGTAGSDGGMGGSVPVGPPSVPTGFSAQVDSNTQVTVSWTDVAGEDGYYVYWSSTNTQPGTPNQTLSADDVDAVLSGLTPAMNYYVWIEAFNAEGSSAALTGTARSGLVPPTPGNVSIDVASSIYQVIVSWDDVAGESYYEIYWANTDTQPATPGDAVAPDSTSYAITDVTEDTPYYVWVEAVNATGSGPGGMAGPATTPISLNWTELHYDEPTGYVFVGVQEPAGAPVTAVWGSHSTDVANPGTLAQWFDRGTTQTHTWLAVNPTVTGYFWTQVTTADGTLTSRPMTLEVGPDMTGTLTATVDAVFPEIDLDWDDATGEGAYEVYYSTTNDFATATLDATLAADTTTHHLTLYSGRTYYFWVRTLGIGIGGNGYPGDPITTNLLTPGPMSTPWRLEIEAGTHDGANRSFGMLMDATGQSACWDNVDMSGNTEIDVQYSYGGAPDVSVDVTFQGSTIGNVPLPHCNAWGADCPTPGSTTFTTQMGVGTLCIVGVGPQPDSWIGAFDYVDVR